MRTGGSDQPPVAATAIDDDVLGIFRPAARVDVTDPRGEPAGNGRLDQRSQHAELNIQLHGHSLADVI